MYFVPLVLKRGGAFFVLDISAEIFIGEISRALTYAINVRKVIFLGKIVQKL
jgi:hypothetical protein